MSRVYELADDYVVRYAALHPNAATSMGVPGHERALTDFSPAGHEARAALERETLAALEAAPIEGDRDRVARDAMAERLRLALELDAADEQYRSLNILASPLQSLRRVFDLMPRETEQQWSNVAARLAALPGRARGLPRAARRGHRARHREHAAPGRRVRAAGRGVERAGGWPAALLRDAGRRLRGLAGRERRRRPGAGRGARRRRAQRRRCVRRARALPRRPLHARGRAARPRGARALRAGRARLHRHGARPRGDLRVGLVGAAPHRGRAGRGRPSASSPARASRR